METAKVRLRPLRYAFLVEPKDRKSLQRVFEVNSSLWGGIFNFIIPVFKNVPPRYRRKYQRTISASAMLQGFVEAFQPDFVIETKAGQKDSHGIDFPPTRTLSIHDLLSRDDQGRCNVGVDLRSVCSDLYDDTFRFVQRHPPIVIVPSCTDKRYSLLFAATYGSLPEKGELSDIAEVYLKALEGERKSFKPSDYPKLYDQKYLHPLRVTTHRLETFRNSWALDAHLFFMDETSPLDLIEFWNYRALGWNITPLPARLAPDLVDFCEKFVADIHKPLPPPSNAWHRTTFLCAQSQSMDKLQAFLKSLKLPPSDSLSINPHVPRIWEEWGRSADHAKPQTVTHTSKTTDARVIGNGLHLDVLPHEFSQADLYCSRNLAAANVIESISGGTPVIPWNRSVAAKLTYNFGEERTWISREGIVAFAGDYTRTSYLRLPNPINIFSALAEASGYELSMSPAGRTCEQIIAAVGGLGAVSVVTRSPELLRFMDRLAHEDLEVEIEEQGNEPGKRKKVHKAFAPLTQAQEVMRRSNPGNEGVAEPHLAALIRRNVLKLGMALNCSKCSHKSWFSLEDLSSEMPCPRCFGEFPFPAGSPPSRDAWAYRVIGPFATAGFAQGAYCVASALHFLANKIAFQSSWLPSFEMVKGGIRELEADFGIFVAPGAISHISTPYLIFGECKSFNKFEEKDFARARKTAQMYRGAVLCFSTFRDSLDRDEIKAIKQIAEAGRDPLDVGRQLNPVLILTARELFGQFRHVDFNSLYGDKAQYARGIFIRREIDELCDFTQQLYLGMPSRHDALDKKRRERIAKAAARKAKKATP